MKLLILGGTKFVGRHIAETALERGHEVSVFHRGQTGPDLLPEAEHILGNRDGELDHIGDRSFDAVLDVSGYLPRLVRDAAKYVQRLTAHYLFISTISVYDTTGRNWVDESTPLLVPPAANVETVTGETYGGLKVACEQAVLEVFPGASIVRPGLVGGPYDHTKRFDQWIQAALGGKDVLIPARAKQSVQLVDARDLANLSLDLAERRVAGIFNATGVETTWKELRRALQQLSTENVKLTEVADETFPMVIAGDDSLFRCRHERATAQGFDPRTITAMVEDAPLWPQNQVV